MKRTAASALVSRRDVLLAAALFGGLALIAGAIVYDGRAVAGSDEPDYAAYERVVRAYVARENVERIERLQGTIFRVHFDQGCSLIDPSKRYETEDDFRFWVTWVGKAGCAP